MSAGTGDDYHPTPQVPEPDHRHDVEPADPDFINHETRRATPIGPESLDIDELPNLLADETDGDRLPTVAEARDVYMRVQQASRNSDDRGSAYGRHRYKRYPHLCVADRQLRKRYDDVTTVMITRRLSPIEDSHWMPPLKIDKQLHDSTVCRSVRRAWARVLDAYQFEYAAVSAPTSTAATPHQHIYLWIDDPDNQITASDFDPVLQKHLKHCPNAYPEDHEYADDGRDGTITVRHEPPLTDPDPAGEHQPITLGAQYLASQLAHLPLGDFYDETKEDPAEALLEGAAIAWASNHKWFRASSGLPDLEDGDQDSELGR